MYGLLASVLERSSLANENLISGKKVVMLERGGYYTDEYLKRQTREEELLKLWKYMGVFLSSDFSVNVAQSECVGGSTMINYGICFRIPEYVFETWKAIMA